MHATPGAKNWAAGAANAVMGGVGVWVCGYWRPEAEKEGKEVGERDGEGDGKCDSFVIALLLMLSS